MKRRIIYAIGKTGDYPEGWSPILTTGDGKYWLGGGTRCYVPIFDTYPDVQRAIYQIKKQLLRFDLQFMTREVK